MRGRRFLAAFLVLLLVPWGADGALPTDIDGNVVVSTDTTVQNETISPASDLRIEPGCTLTLIDCTLIMGEWSTILVKGDLVMRNVTVSCTDPGPKYDMTCGGRLDMDKCNVSGSFSWRLNAWSHDCSITGSMFNMSGAGISIENGTPVLRGNRFIAGAFQSFLTPMVHSRNASPVIENNTFDGNLMRFEGLEVYYPDSPVIANNTFVNCSVGLGYYYIHQHANDGTTAPSPGEPADIRDNTFRRCLYGMVATESPQGNGMGRAGAPSRAYDPVAPVFIARGNSFEGNSEGLYGLWEAPSVIEHNDFSGNGNGVRLDTVYGMRLSNCTFTNNTVGASTSHGELSLARSTFSTNDRNLVCDHTSATVEGSTFHGGENTSASLYTYYDSGILFANNTVLGPRSIGLRLEGTGVVFNNTFRDCPFGVYRAVRQYGQGHGRDSQGPPGPAPDMAVISQNRFQNNTRGIYTEGWTEIAYNEFNGNQMGVEASCYQHPAETGYGNYDYNLYFERFDTHHNTLSNNTEGVLLLFAGDCNDDTCRDRNVRANNFTGNGIGIDVIISEAAFHDNNFSQDNGWAFRQIGSDNDVSDNLFGGCDREWRQTLFDLEVAERTMNDQDEYYLASENATVRVTAGSGEVLLSDRTNWEGRVPWASWDGFTYSDVNLTVGKVLADGTAVGTAPVLAEAWKAGAGAASETVDLYSQLGVTLILEPTPDLRVDNLSFTRSSAVAGDFLTANFTVRNDNTYDPANVSLQDVLVEVALDGVAVEMLAIPWLRPGEPQERGIEWTAAPGNHTWTVTIDPNGVYRDLRRDNNRAVFRIDVNGRPEAVIAADRTEALTSEDILFTGAGSRDDGNVTAWSFDFGDGGISAWSDEPTAAYSYRRAGAYEARLKVRDDRGLESDWSRPLAVTVANRPPAMELAAAPLDVLTLEPVNFSAVASDAEEESLNVGWDFGDGHRMTGRGLFLVAHAYADNGLYAVRVTVSDSDGGSDVSSVNVTVRNRPPAARFSAFPANGTVLTRFSFLPAGSDPDGRVVSYLWDLGDRSSSVSDRPFRTYGSPGVYNVTLTVRDDDGAESLPFTLAVLVQNTPPVVRARLAEGRPRAGQALTFDASASFDAEGPALDIRWFFGDGSTAEGAVVKHAFERPGNYTVRVRVTDSSGATAELLLPVAVLGAEPPAEDDGWRVTAAGSGLLTIAGAVFLAWVLTHRPKPVRSPPRTVRPARGAKGRDVYGERLARSRAARPRRESGNRSLYDAMQPVRENKK